MGMLIRHFDPGASYRGVIVLKRRKSSMNGEQIILLIEVWKSIIAEMSHEKGAHNKCPHI